MVKKECPNGHIYDQSIYGDTCPLCPSPARGGNTNATPDMTIPVGGGASTRVVQPSNPTMKHGGTPQGFPNNGNVDPMGETKVNPNIKQQISEAQQQAQQAGGNSRTRIRHNPGMMGASVKPDDNGRKLVGFLVTYNRTPMGKAFNIYEGRNYIGRDASCDIAIPDDNLMSGKHMLIRYLSGNNKFSFKDEMSSNGTYVNKELLDEGELHNYDIIRVGSTIFIFIAIPQI
ncbi:MAG: FHA domain-containing protein [Muribaculaceae bacterium]